MVDLPDYILDRLPGFVVFAVAVVVVVVDLPDYVLDLLPGVVVVVVGPLSQQ